MLPEHANIFGTQNTPSSMVTHEPGVKAINLWRRDDFGRSVRVKRPKHVNHESGLHHIQVIRDRCVAYAAGLAEFGCLKDSAALNHQKFRELLEGTSSLQAKKFLNILGPVSIHPFLEVPLRKPA